MKNNIYLLLLIIFFAFACGNSGKKNEQNSKTQVLEHNIEIADTSFAEFWKIFRLSIINNDTLKLMELTNFPLETRGPQDSDPIVKYSKNQFTTVLKTFLKQDYDENETEFKLIERLEILKKGDQKEYVYDNNWARVGEFEFKFIKGKWKLTFAYLYYGAMDEINRNLNKK